jgi:hypothetical protein
LPLLSSTRCPPRALYVFTLAVPLFAADGLDALAARFAPSRRAPLLAAALGLVALDLLATHRHENPSTTLEAARAAGTLDARRFLAAHEGDRFVNDVHLDHALHNAGLAWGLENASGYSSLPSWRWLHALWIANHAAVYPHPKIHDDLAAQGLWRFSSPIVSLLSVRWVLAREPPNAPGYVKRFAGADRVDVYENLAALPRAWVVHRARSVDGAAQAANALAAADFDPRAEAILEGAPSPAPSGAGPDRVALSAPSPTERVAHVELAAPGVLVLADPFYPGWRATLDGREVPLLAADYALRGVAVPAGAHTVEMRYRSAPLEAGLVACAIALLATLALALRRPRAE